MTGTTKGYAVCVTFEVKPESRTDFLSRVRRQATDSLAEPGCRVFDVWSGGETATEVFLYEIYDDRAAFDAHLTTVHFANFDAAVADMVASKRVATWEAGQ